MRFGVYLVAQLLLGTMALVGVTNPVGTPGPSAETCVPAGTPPGYACLEWQAPLGWGPWGLHIADLSGDGQPEILVGNSHGWLRVYDGTTHAELANVTVSQGSDPWIRSVAVADLDDDGRQEVVVGTHPNARLYIYEWERADLISEWNSTQLGDPWRDGVLGTAIEALEVADVDLDGALEIVAMDAEYGVYVLGYAGGGRYVVEAWQGPFSCQFCHALAVANVDRDPTSEILRTSGPQGLQVYNGTSLQPEWSIPGLYGGLAVGDLDGDGNPELVVGTNDAWWIVDPRSRAIVAQVPGQTSPRQDVVIGDFDRDGDAEFAGVIMEDRLRTGGSPAGFVEVFDGKTLEAEWRSPNLDIEWRREFLAGFAFRVEAGNVDADGPTEILAAVYGGVFQFQVGGANRPPVASVAAVAVVEGAPAVLDASASTDPDGDVLAFRWDFDGDGTWDTEWLPDSTATYTWGDDWTGVVRVEVSDGTLASMAEAPVFVANEAPAVSASVAVRANEPRTQGYWNQQCRKENPPSPDHVGIQPAYIEYVGANSRVFAGVATREQVCDVLDGHGAGARAQAELQLMALWLNVASGKLAMETPVELDLTDAQTLAATVADIEDVLLDSRAPREEVLRAKDISDAINNGRGIAVAVAVFTATAVDPGSDDLTVAWDFGDGSTVATTYHNDGVGPDPFPSPGGTFPFTVTHTVAHAYSSPGVYRVTLVVTDDDGGQARIALTSSFP